MNSDRALVVYATVAPAARLVAPAPMLDEDAPLDDADEADGQTALYESFCHCCNTI
jgi:hypothetical protein